MFNFANISDAFVAVARKRTPFFLKSWSKQMKFHATVPKLLSSVGSSTVSMSSGPPLLSTLRSVVVGLFNSSALASLWLKKWSPQKPLGRQTIQTCAPLALRVQLVKVCSTVQTTVYVTYYELSVLCSLVNQQHPTAGGGWAETTESESDFITITNTRKFVKVQNSKVKCDR